MDPIRWLFIYQIEISKENKHMIYSCQFPFMPLFHSLNSYYDKTERNSNLNRNFAI